MSMREKVERRAARLRGKLADALLSAGLVRDSRWSSAFREVPRHVFLPRFFRQRPDGKWEALDSDHPDWLSLIYGDQVWVTQLDGDDTKWERARRNNGVIGVPTCSSSMPAIMAIMLEALDVHWGQSVLEIGAGTGYNAALLCHALGEEQVTTVDVDAGVLTRASEHLARSGYRPTCAVGDGALGFAANAPYDRVLCTCSVSRIPLAWLDQTVPGGLVVTTLNRQIGAGLVRIEVGDGPRGEGRVLSEDGRFMPLRADGQPWSGDLLRSARTAEAESARETSLDADAVLSPSSPFEFFAGLALSDVAASVGTRGQTWFAHRDGSWVRHGTRNAVHVVEQGGPRRLWDVAEAAHQQWQELGQPRRHRFGVTVEPGTQYLWLDRSDSSYRWEL
jgi:methyltransferase of ATP-grasp peptide maturase system